MMGRVLGWSGEMGGQGLVKFQTSDSLDIFLSQQVFQIVLFQVLGVAVNVFDIDDFFGRKLDWGKPIRIVLPTKIFKNHIFFTVKIKKPSLNKIEMPLNQFPLF